MDNTLQGIFVSLIYCFLNKEVTFIYLHVTNYVGKFSKSYVLKVKTTVLNCLSSKLLLGLFYTGAVIALRDGLFSAVSVCGSVWVC